MNIRKMNRKIYTLPELIHKNLCSNEIAAFLHLCLIKRINITAVGETNTGKTTLINSLDLLVPSDFRKIYIEESLESLTIPETHQLKYKVDSGYTNTSKIDEIHRLLHRNPDLVYLGEILTKQEAHAMFHCLSAGLRGFQTIHARDINSLINRWQYHFEIEPSCFNDLDVVVLLKRSNSKRYIARIVEIQYNSELVKIKPIFTYNPDLLRWEKITSWTDLQSFQRLNLSGQEQISINKQLQFYENIFRFLSNQHSWNPKHQFYFFQSVYKKATNSSNTTSEATLQSIYNLYNMSGV